MSSASLLVSLESNSGLYKESVQFVPSAFGMEVPEKANVTVDSVSLNEKVQLSHDSRSIADSILSASLLVSVDADTDIDSISDDEQAVSPSIQSNEADVLPDDKIQSEDISEEPDHIKEKEMSAHRMKHNVIQELKSSSRFKFKQSGANGAPSFADELAVVTGKKTVNSDFASSLAKRVAEKGQCKTRVKKSQRKILKPVDLSPPPQSTTTDVSEFLSDYW
jgi:hypothetical protein